MDHGTSTSIGRFLFLLNGEVGSVARRGIHQAFGRTVTRWASRCRYSGPIGFLLQRVLNDAAGQPIARCVVQELLVGGLEDLHVDIDTVDEWARELARSRSPRGQRRRRAYRPWKCVSAILLVAANCSEASPLWLSEVTSKRLANTSARSGCTGQ